MVTDKTFNMIFQFEMIWSGKKMKQTHGGKINKVEQYDEKYLFHILRFTGDALCIGAWGMS